MFNNYINFSRTVTKTISIGLLGILLLVIGTAYAFSQINGVDISPSHTRKVTAGQVIVYEHILTNNTPSTDTFTLEINSTQGWPVELVGGIYPTGTVLLPLQVGAQMTAPFQIRLTVPLNTGGITEITVITATSQTSPTIRNTITDTTIVLNQVYLPLVLKRWPPIPYRPTLAVIQEADDGNYSVSWSESPSRLANTYILQEAKDAAFTTELREVCTTAQQSCNVSSKVAGLYYYRVRGHNDWGDGEWSNAQSASVLLPDTPTLNVIDNSDGNGSFAVSWNGTARASSYTLQEDITPAFSNPVAVYNGSQTAWAANGKTVGTYYYRVLATGATGQSNWSAAQSAIVLPPDTPSLNPIDNTDGDTTYSITWSVSARATSYTLQEDSSAAFGNPTVVYEGTTQSWTATNKSPGTHYYRVRGNGPTGQGGWSNVQAVTVPPPPSPLGDGFHLVGSEIKPGKWHSTGTGTSCYWARYDSNQNILDNHFGLAGGTVNVRPTDYEVEFNRCGMWEYVELAAKVLLPNAAEPKGDGFYTVGVEIVSGRWRSTGTGTSCYWARLDSYQDILDNHFGQSGGTVTIRDTDYEAEFHGCGTWVFLGP